MRIAVAGCGRLALNVHLPVLARLRDVAVTAIIDPDPAQREAALRLHPQARAFAQLEDIWNSIDVDAIIISTPPWSHASLALDAIRHGKHIYLEKPIAGRIEEAVELVAAWKDRALIGMMGFNYRFHSLFQSARRLLSEGAVGTPLLISTVFASSISSRNDWRGGRHTGGGALLELGSHHVDLIHFLTGAKIVQALAHNSSHAEDGTATLQLRLDSGALANCCFSFGTVDQDRVEIFGDRALLRVDRNLSTSCEIIPVDRQRARLRQLTSALSFLWRPQNILSKNRAPGHEPSYRAALEQFVRAIRTGSAVSPDFEDGYRALAVLDAAQRSSLMGSWVDTASAGGRVS